jgi:beta-lactamase class D
LPAPSLHKEEKALVGDELAEKLEEMGHEENDKKKKAKDNTVKDVDLSPFFKGFKGTFVMYESGEGTVKYNAERAAKRFSPCSTFKIPHTLIALETGVVDGADTLIKWDEKKYPKEPWWDEMLLPLGMDWAKDHTLKSAFEQSVVWYYREIAGRIGEEKMKKYLARFDYGNRNISGGLDTFWLSSSLEVSADEQVVFLRRFVEQELGVSSQTTKTARDVFIQEDSRTYNLYAKTGTCVDDGKLGIGWYVGFVERGAQTYVFAFNMEGDQKNIGKYRVKTAKAILEKFGVLPH